MQAWYTARVSISHDRDTVAFLFGDEDAENLKTIEARFQPDGCAAWTRQEDWYDQYDGASFAFPWELENAPAFQAVCADILAQIAAATVDPVESSIRAVVEESQRFGSWRKSKADGWRVKAGYVFITDEGIVFLHGESVCRDCDARMIGYVEHPLTEDEVRRLIAAAAR